MQHKCNKTIIFLVCLVAIGCQSNKRDIALEQSLKFAEENEKELVKVLKHFEKDSLKLEAAKFLIRNMPFHYYYENNTLEKYYKDYYNIVTTYGNSIDDVADSLDGVYGKMALSNHAIFNDAKSINANYLIENINHVFMA